MYDYSICFSIGGVPSLYVYSVCISIGGVSSLYVYSDLPVDALPLDTDVHEPYVSEMTFDPRHVYPEPL